MLCLRRNEKLLDALLSLAEIFRLVSYSEHVPYALLILPWVRLWRSGNGRVRQHSAFRALYVGTVVRLSPNVSKSVVHGLLQIGLTKRLRLLSFRGYCRLCSQISTGSHRQYVSVTSCSREL